VDSCLGLSLEGLRTKAGMVSQVGCEHVEWAWSTYLGGFRPAWRSKVAALVRDSKRKNGVHGDNKCKTK
jgi:hypothetical protein